MVNSARGHWAFGVPEKEVAELRSQEDREEFMEGSNPGLRGGLYGGSGRCRGDRWLEPGVRG